jgi:hypothetical protein
MSDPFATLIDVMRDKTIAEVRSHPVVVSGKALCGADAAAFLRAYRSHLADKGPLARTHGAAADIAAFSVAQAIVPHASVDTRFLLDRIGWPSAEAWDAAMLARAHGGQLSTDEIVAALQSSGFAAQASFLLPFGSDAWAVKFRSLVDAWPKKRKASWTALVELARNTDLPLRPSDEWLTSGAAKAVSKALAPCLDDIMRCLDIFAAPLDEITDRSRPSQLTRAAEENAKLLHALVLFIAAQRPDGWQGALRRVQEVASTSIAGLGGYLPKLAWRASLALEAADAGAGL